MITILTLKLYLSLKKMTNTIKLIVHTILLYINGYQYILIKKTYINIIIYLPINNYIYIYIYYYITILLYYYITILLYYYITILLYYYITILLYYYITIIITLI